jgi:hypothetical protein
MDLAGPSRKEIQAKLIKNTLLSGLQACSPSSKALVRAKSIPPLAENRTVGEMNEK